LLSTATILGAACAGPQPPEPPSHWEDHYHAGIRAIGTLQFARADEEFERALRSIGPGPSAENRRALVQIGLAISYRRQFRLEEAEELLLELIESERSRGGPNLARALETLGLVYLEQEDAGRGCPPLEEAYALRRVAFGPNHRSLATAENNLGSCHRVAGRHDVAIAFYKRALVKYGQTRQHGPASITLNNLALTLEKQRRVAEAEVLHKRAIGLSVRTQGYGNVNQAKFSRDLGALYLSVGREQEARKLLEQATRWFRTNLGPDHREVLETRKLLQE
jgi:tetratricopeptide (TPR) repeat protein